MVNCGWRLGDLGIPPSAESQVFHVAKRAVLRNEPILEGRRRAGSNAAAETCRPSGTKRAEKTNPFPRTRHQGPGRATGGPEDGGSIVNWQLPIVNWLASIGTTLTYADHAIARSVRNFAKLCVSLRSFPKRCVSLRFVAFRSAPFRVVQGAGYLPSRASKCSRRTRSGRPPRIRWTCWPLT